MNTPDSAASRLGFAALNFDCEDPATLAEFWGKVLGRPANPGAVPGDWAVEATDQAAGPRLIFHPVAPRLEVAESPVRPILITDHYEAEIERVTGLGAKSIEETKLPAARYTTFADPAGHLRSVATEVARQLGHPDPDEAGQYLVVLHDGALVASELDDQKVVLAAVRSAARQLLDPMTSASQARQF